MIKLCTILFLLLSLALPVSAVDLQAPAVPDHAETWMPAQTESFADGLWDLAQKAVSFLRPELSSGLQTSISILTAVFALSLIGTFSENAKRITGLAGCTMVSILLLSSMDSMIQLGAKTIQDLSQYGKLLFPVITAATAAQGGLTASTALYTGTAAFDALLTALLSSYLVPLVYLFLALAVGNSATGEDLLKRLKDMIKSFVTWCLKTVLMIFTTYMSITGVISGTTDAAALKATKVTISSVVPVVGGILSDASEAVLVSAGLVKNSAGIYGIFAFLALFLEPFMKIGMQYLVLKMTSAVCSIFASKNLSGLVEDFAAALGILLGMTGASCMLLLISTVCFLRSVG